MADYKVGDIASLINSSSPSNETSTNDLFVKKKKKRSAQNEEEIVVNSNEVGEGSLKKKKRKHKEKENVEEKLSQTSVTTPDSNNAEEPQKKKKKHKKNAESNETNNEAAVTDVTADSTKAGRKRIRKKKKKSAATEANEMTDAVAPTENGIEKKEKKKPSVKGKVKITEKTTSGQADETKTNKNKLKKQRRKEVKKLKKIAAKEKSKTDSENVEPTVTLENKEKKKDVSKKETKKERIKDRKSQSLPTKHPDAEARTIFIGNVHMQVKRKELLKVFSNYGKVEAVRIRGVAVGEQGMLKKVAQVTGQMHPSRSSVTAYVRFESTDSVTAALEANGMILREYHLNVDRAVHETKRELRNAVFVGNLPFEAEDEKFYQHFIACGEIESVRIVRDKVLKSGKGFGYVNFKSSDATEVALQLNGKMFMNRPLRVIRCTKKPKKDKTKDDNITKKSNMKLDFMKKKTKPNYQQTNEKVSKESDFSGAKTAESGKNKKIKKPRWNKEDKKKVAVARLLTGDKAAVQRPKFTSKKPGGKPTGKPIAKKFGGKPGGKFGGKPGGKFEGKPGGKFGGKPGGKPFAGKPGAGKAEVGGTGQNKRIKFD